MLYEKKKVYFDKKGYAVVWVAGRNKKVHILEWEKYNGKKPKGFQIHHKDDNKGNWHIDNLELLTQSDHFRLHSGWVRKDKEWIAKPCKDCGYTLPLDEFYQRKGLTPSNRCIQCSLVYWKEIAQNPDFRNKRKKYMLSYYKTHKEKWQ